MGLKNFENNLIVIPTANWRCEIKEGWIFIEGWILINQKPGVEVFGLIFVRNAVNAVIICNKFGDCGECGDNKNFTTFHRISYKNSPQKNHLISYKIHRIHFCRKLM